MAGEDVRDRYPEHAKLQALQGKNDAVARFLEWLQEKEYMICDWTEEGTTEIKEDERWQEVPGAYLPLNRSIESWLAEFFEINPVKLEQEKRAILAELTGGL